jgi:iron complex transport system ATP-binding protein
MTQALTVELQSVTYRTPQGKTLVQPTTLHLNAGQHLAIVGPNGAGKSTLLRLLAGTLQPSAGKIHYDGVSAENWTPLERAQQVALLGQTNQADARLNVLDYVRLGCLPHRKLLRPAQLEAIVAEALERCSLHGFRGRSLGSLSGGERQRAHLARALAQQPRLLLLDEPTNHLDPRATLDLLQGIASLGITVVAVLHDLALVPQWAHQVAVVQAGALLAYGTPAQALTPPVVHGVFAMHAFYLPHPTTAEPMLVMDTCAPAAPHATPRKSFFTTYGSTEA